MIHVFSFWKSIKALLWLPTLRYLLTGIPLLIPFFLPGQQFPQYSQYLMHPTIYHPSVAVRNDAMCFGLGYRNQWMGFEDSQGKNISPRDFLVTAGIPVYALNSRIGIVVNNSNLGYHNRTDFRLDYGFQVEVSSDNFLGFGLSGQLSRYQMNLGQLTVADPSDPLIKETDKQQAMFPEMGFGILYNGNNRFFAGISMMNLLASEYELGNLRFKDQQTAIFSANYKIGIIDDRYRKVYFVPSVLLKSNFKTTQIDLNTTAFINDKYWAGMGYRLQDGFIINAGIYLGDLMVGLSYDMNTGKIRDATKGGSVEIHLGYCLPIEKPRRIKSGFNTRCL